MRVLDSPRTRAGTLIVALGCVLVVAVAPFAVGLVGAGVLYALCRRPYQRLRPRIGARSAAAAMVAACAIGVIAPVAWLGQLAVRQAPDALRTVHDAVQVLTQQVAERLAPRPEAPRPEAPRPEAPRPEAPRPEAPRADEPRPAAPSTEAAARVTSHGSSLALRPARLPTPATGQETVRETVREAVHAHLQRGATQISAVALQAIGALVSAAAHGALHFVVALFGLYFLLLEGEALWTAVLPMIPFAPRHAEALREQFYAVTYAAIASTAVIAIVQGVLLGAGFALTGIAQPTFWGAVAGLLSFTPIVGNSIVWLGAMGYLATAERWWGVAVMLGIVLVMTHVDNIIRPLMGRRLASLHPMVTLLGVFMALPYAGLLGIVVGPLTISYFFALARMYHLEYGVADVALPATAHLDAETLDRPRRETRHAEIAREVRSGSAPSPTLSAGTWEPAGVSQSGGVA